MTDQQRVAALEERLERQRVELQELRLELAVLATQQKQLISKLDNFSTGINRGLWLLGGGFVSAIVAWIVGGGLSL